MGGKTMIIEENNIKNERKTHTALGIKAGVRPLCFSLKAIMDLNRDWE